MLDPKAMIVAMLAVNAASPSAAQSQALQPAQQTLESVGPELAPDQTYSDVVIVALETLSGPTKQDVEEVIEVMNADDLRELQGTIGQSRQAVLMLASVGLNPTQVVAAGVTPDGVLTLVVQQTA